MSSEIRVPKQKRSIEKMNKIIDAGFILFCEKGYYNTNTAEIAKKAGVSTGIVYNYFTDKKDIFLKVLDKYGKEFNLLLIDAFNTLKEPYDLTILVNQILDGVIESHMILKDAHQEMMAMSYLDEDIKEFFLKFEEDLYNKYVEVLQSIGLHLKHPYETVHLIIDIIQSFVHDFIYRQHEFIDYQVYREQCVASIVFLLTR